MSTTIYRTTAFLFSIACYGAFLLVFLYLLAFLGNLQATPLADAFPLIRAWVPTSVDLGRDMGSPAAAVLVNLGLLLIFGLQHSVMARPGFKRVWTRVVPKELERSLYVLIASAVLALLMWQWRPIPTPVLWHADAAWSVALAWSVMGLGVAVLLWATFLINHFELFGLQQGWIALRGGELRGPAFVTPYLYKIVRHPLYVGWLLIFWGVPTMTAGHLLVQRIARDDLAGVPGQAYEHVHHPRLEMRLDLAPHDAVLAGFDVALADAESRLQLLARESHAAGCYIRRTRIRRRRANPASA